MPKEWKWWWHFDGGDVDNRLSKVCVLSYRPRCTSSPYRLLRWVYYIQIPVRLEAGQGVRGFRLENQNAGTPQTSKKSIAFGTVCARFSDPTDAPVNQHNSEFLITCPLQAAPTLR